MRYNVDDDWFADPTKRRATLIRSVRDLPRNVEREADGLALDAWRLAARYWKDGKQLIPKEVWDRADLAAMVEADLAIVKPEGVYVRGIELRGEYLLDRKEAGALGGKASVESRKRKFGTAQPRRSTPEANGDASTDASKLSEANAFASSKQPEAKPNLPKPPPPSPSLPPPQSHKETSSLVVRGPTPAELVAIWNELRDKATQPEAVAIKPGTKRYKAAAARLKEHPDHEGWRTVVTFLAQSAWHTGQNDRGWSANFDYLVKPETYASILERAQTTGIGKNGAAKTWVDYLSEEERARL